MAPNDRYEQTVLRIASDVLGVANERLEGSQSMMDLKATDADYRMIFERSAEALGVELMPIIDSMPVYSVKASDTTMGSLRMIGAISSPAAALLDRYTVRPVDDTLDSIAAGLRTGKFVDSGRKQPAVHEPYSKTQLLFWLLAPMIVLLVVFPIGIAYMEHRQCCFAAPTSVQDSLIGRAYRSDGPILVAGPFAALLLGGQLIPGLLALRTETRLRRERKNI